MIYVVIPAFNEAGSLARLVPEIPDSLEGRPVMTVVVCDGSTDGTCQVALDYGASVVSLWPNSGKGAAIQAANPILVGRDFDAVVFMDGDGQHDPADLSALVRPVVFGDCEVVIGSRYANDPSRGSTPLNRYLVRSFFTWVLGRRLEQDVTDPFTGFRCLSRDAFDSIRLTGARYEGELEVRFEAEIHDLTVSEVEVRRIYGGDFSKMRANGGMIGGRMRVVRGYASTLRRKTKELAAARQVESVPSSA